MVELTFILGKGEKIIKEAERVQYSGVAQITIGTGGFGTNQGLGGGLFTGKTIKREGSIFDAKTTHVYLTNKRIVFCNAKTGLFGGKEKSVGTPFSEIRFNTIKGINTNTKLTHPAIDLSVNVNGSIDNVKFWFLGSKQREQERDEFLKLIKKQL